MNTTEIALTAHVMMPVGHPGDAFLAPIRHELQEQLGIQHVTIQIEVKDTEQTCDLDACRVVALSAHS